MGRASNTRPHLNQIWRKSAGIGGRLPPALASPANQRRKGAAEGTACLDFEHVVAAIPAGATRRAETRRSWGSVFRSFSEGE
jgi:hypothetical protein